MKNIIKTRYAPNFDITKSMQCGQSFRWKKEENSNVWFGVAYDKPLYIEQSTSENKVTFTMPEDNLNFWLQYFRFEDDNLQLETQLRENPLTAPSAEYSKGIHLFEQEPFETTISFIISANNNVTRICGIIDRICEYAGEKQEWNGKVYSLFPTPEQLASVSENKLRELGCGYRAAYIAKTAQQIADGFDFGAISRLSEEEANQSLCKLAGVGKKVASCIQLFSLGFNQVVPVDVWVKRILKILYPEYSADEAVKTMQEEYGNNTGLAQQYLFHYARATGMGKKKVNALSEK